MRGAVIGLIVATAFILSRCQYLLGGIMGGPVTLPGGSFDRGAFGSFDPGGSIPAVPFSLPNVVVLPSMVMLADPFV